MVYIVEGIDGSGKSSVCKYLNEYLESISKKSVILREPGGTKEAEYIRNIIKDPNVKISKEQQLQLFILARYFITNYIRHDVFNTDYILDRFIPSTIAYQHYGLGLSLELIQKLHDNITPYSKTILEYSTIIYLKTDPEVALSRILKRGDVPDKFEKIDFLQKVSDGYDKFFKTKPSKRFIQIDTSNRTEKQVCKELQKAIEVDLCQ